VKVKNDFTNFSTSTREASFSMRSLYFDRNGGQIALLIIISSLVLLGVANWVWKKYFLNKKLRSQQK